MIFHQRITKLIHDDEIGAVDQSQVVVHGLLLPRLLELGHQVICADKFHAVTFVDDGVFPKSYGQMGFPKPGLAVKSTFSCEAIQSHLAKDKISDLSSSEQEKSKDSMLACDGNLAIPIFISILWVSR